MSDEEFVQQCEEAGDKVLTLVLSYPMTVAICVLSAVLASVMKAWNVPREAIIAALDYAPEDIDG